MTNPLLSRADALESTYVALRREIHSHPETAFAEVCTAERIEAELRACGMEVFRRDTMVVGVLRGAAEGKTVVLRADIDALPMDEKTGLPYASQTAGACHACGHDLHTTALLFAAKLLSEQKDQLKGTVKFLFQPAEEKLSGAQFVLESPEVLADADVIFAAHSWPDFTCGTVGIRFGPMMAAADTFEIKVFAQGGHAAHPQRTADPVLVAAHIIAQLHTIVSREIAATESAVVTVGEVHAGSAPNIIPSEAVLRGTARSLTEETRTRIRESIERIAMQTATSLKAEAKVSFNIGCPPLRGDPALVSMVESVAKELLGKDKVLPLEVPSLGSEDFAYYLQKIPGAFFRIGTGDERPESRLGLHNPRLVFNEDAIKVGALMFTNIALTYTDSSAK